MRRKRLLAAASAGGHWVELQRLTPALVDHAVYFLTTDPRLRAEVDGTAAGFYAVQNTGMWRKRSLLVCAAQVAFTIARIRPDIVISTGAAPGFFALAFGKLFGARTIWIDSVANCEEMSLSGKKVRPWADLWLTQWEHLSSDGGPDYAGSVL